MPNQLSLHATCVCIGEFGVLIIGNSGSGKSSLAAGLMAYDAKLVADDRVLLWVQDGALLARCPDAIKGKMELYGVGIIDLIHPVLASASIGLIVHCKPNHIAERMPSEQTATYLGVEVPLLEIDPFHPFAAAKLRLLSQSCVENAQRKII